MMPHMREVKTCDRCRQFKRRCDLLKPSCSRCLQAGVQCSFDTAAAVAAAAATATSTTTAASTPGSTATASATSSAPPSAASTTAVFSPKPKPEPPVQVGLHRYPSVGSSPLTPQEAPVTPGSIESDPGATEFAAEDIQLPSRRRSNTQVLIQRVVRKRKRNCLSCLRCHRLKVKCDKELPCGRCKSSGNGGDCYYSYNKGPNSGKFPCPTLTPAIIAQIPPTGENRSGANGWQITHKVRGTSHWRDLMSKLGTMIKLDSPKLADALGNVASNACLSSFALPGNFPFGTPGASKYYARDAIMKLLETERANCPEYIKRYIDLLDTVNPVLDLSKFYHEVDQYWEDPSSVSLCWLSMFLMVLGLGCFSTADEPYQATELMMAAEACLVQTPFMFRPTLATLRALTLMVVAKHVCNATCWACDSCWSLLGLVVRTAFTFGLPQASSAADGTSTPDLAERETQKKLWLTIAYLDIKTSMTAGMPFLTRPEEIESLDLIPEGVAPNSFETLLYQSLPIVLRIMGKLNDHGGQLPYPEVLEYNTQLRGLLQHVRPICSTNLQYVTMDTVLRRTLMVLHRPYALHEQGPFLYPVSYWSSLECSLAMLMHYRELFAADSCLRYDLIGRAFVLDFFSATLTTFVHVLRKDAPLSGAAASDCDVQIPPRQLILDTLRGNVDIWAEEADKSVCYQTGLNILNGVLDSLPEMDRE